MVANVINIWGEIIGIGIGGLILLTFAITFSPIVRRPSTLPGEAGSRTTRGQKNRRDAKSEAGGGEVVRADGYIDSFGGVIEEAGGGLPLIVKITAVAIPLWWLIYMILNWTQFILSMRTFR